jgi:hypothetical protein
MVPTFVPGRTHDSRSAVPDTVSPELALVDPDLRRRAREALPEAAEQEAAEQHRRDPIDGRRAGPRDEPAYEGNHREGIVEERSRTRLFLERLVTVVLLVAAVGLIMSLAHEPNAHDRNERDTARPGHRTRNATDALAPQEARRSAPTEQRRRVAPRPSPKGARIVAPVDGDSASRTFVWPLVRGADYYNVQFLRGRRKMFEAWPRKPRLAVPARGVSSGRAFTFSPGRYRWLVRPGFGTPASRRYGRPIVVSTFAVARTGPR